MPGREAQPCSGPVIPCHTIAEHRSACVFIKPARIVRAIELYDQICPAAVDNVFCLEEMRMHRAQLVFLRYQQLFSVAHAFACIEIGQPPVAQGKQHKAHLIEAAFPVIGDIPPAAGIDQMLCRCLARNELFRAPIRKGGQYKSVLRDEGARVRQDVVDARPLHGDLRWYLYVARVLETPHRKVEMAPDQANFKTCGTFPFAQACRAAPNASNKGFDTGSSPARYSGCHCTDRVKPGASLM